jgi:hypothetical protein
MRGIALAPVSGLARLADALGARVREGARRNAYAAVCDDRERAAERRRAERMLAELAAPVEPRSSRG